MRDIRDKIICKYKEDCHKYSINESSICPNCIRNKYKDIMKIKEDQYQPKLSAIITDVIGVLIIISIVIQSIYYILT